jgi:hypothetical protein
MNIGLPAHHMGVSQTRSTPPRPLARRKWLPSEDDHLREQVKRYREYQHSFSLVPDFIQEMGGKPVDWTKVARGLSNRNNKDCRKRWLKIDDRWGQGSWAPDEDDRLRAAVRQFHAR